MSCQQGHGDAAECECNDFGLLKIRNLGVLTSYGWRLHPAIAEPAAIEKAS